MRKLILLFVLFLPYTAIAQEEVTEVDIKDLLSSYEVEFISGVEFHKASVAIWFANEEPTDVDLVLYAWSDVPGIGWSYKEVERWTIGDGEIGAKVGKFTAPTEVTLFPWYMVRAVMEVPGDPVVDDGLVVEEGSGM